MSDSEEQPQERRDDTDNGAFSSSSSDTAAPAVVYEITQTDQVNAKLLSTFIQQLEVDPDRFFVEKVAQLDADEEDEDAWQD